jgi:hypothetical protein
MARKPSVHWSSRDRCWRSDAGGKPRYFRELAPNAAGRREAERLLAESLVNDPAPPRKRKRPPKPKPVEVPQPLEIPADIAKVVKDWRPPSSWQLLPGESVEGALAAFLAMERQRSHQAP